MRRGEADRGARTRTHMFLSRVCISIDKNKETNFISTTLKKLTDMQTIQKDKPKKIPPTKDKGGVGGSTPCMTYMGNKRKLVGHIEDVIDHVRTVLGKDHISFADPFSGSGVVSTMAMRSGKCSHIMANDVASYAHVINLCQLRPLQSRTDRARLRELIDQANALTDKQPLQKKDEWFAKHWAPQNDNDIQEGERCYFTRENALIIDTVRNFIQSDAVPDLYKPHLLAPLLVQASIHNNTNGQFAAYYKDETGVGCFGGKKRIDLKRITGRIALPYPEEPAAGNCPTVTKTTLTQKDTYQWCRDLIDIDNDTSSEHSTAIETIDLVYLDPPYNKHPYNVYYFLLDIICTWDKTIDIPDTYRGQPKTWTRSAFNSTVSAHEAMRKLIHDIPSRFVALSYYSAGIVSVQDIDTIMQELGHVERHVIPHNTYKKLYGIGAYKREKEPEAAGCATEYLWVLQKTTKTTIL